MGMTCRNNKPAPIRLVPGASANANQKIYRKNKSLALFSNQQPVSDEIVGHMTSATSVVRGCP